MLEFNAIRAAEMRNKIIAVAVVRDERGRFLVTYNAKWGGYAFPMQDFDPQQEVGATIATAALETDLQRRLRKASAVELEFLGAFGRSGRSVEETWYDYWLFEVDPGEPFVLSQQSQGASHPPRFLDADALLSGSDLTWSTLRLAQAFLEHQNAVLAIIMRPGKIETEYLVVWSENYQGYFFPTTRIKTEHKPEQVAAKLIHADLGYRGPALANWVGEVKDVHFSGRVLRNRNFHFHICRVDLPDVDLQRPANSLELALADRRKRVRWVTADELADATNEYSPTMNAVRPAVLTAAPPIPRRDPERRSEGGLALICRAVDGETEWLAQWNKRWQALFFIGGHRKPPETFRECVVREVQEELGLKPGEFSVSARPEVVLEYDAHSRSAGCPTRYLQQCFGVTIMPVALERVGREHDNVWLSAREIRHLEARDARPVSMTMLSILSMSGAIVM